MLGKLSPCSVEHYNINNSFTSPVCICGIQIYPLYFEVLVK